METRPKSTRKKRKKKPLNLPAERSLQPPAPSASPPAAALARPGGTVNPPRRRRPKRNQPKRSQLKNLAAPAQEKRRKLERRKRALPRKKTRKRRKKAKRNNLQPVFLPTHNIKGKKPQTPSAAFCLPSLMFFCAP